MTTTEGGRGDRARTTDERGAAALAVAAIVIAVSAIAGTTWTRLTGLTTWGSGPAGTPWTASALLVVAGSVLATGPVRRWLAALAAGLSIVAVTSPGLVRSLQRLAWVAAPGRPAAGVGVATILLAGAAWFTATDVTVKGVATALAAGAAAIANLSMLGRLTDDPWLVSAGDVAGPGAMSLPTIVMILLLAVALWLRDDPAPLPLMVRAPARQPALAAAVSAVALPMAVALWPTTMPRESTGYAVIALLVVAATMAAQLASAAVDHRDALAGMVRVVDVSPDAVLFLDRDGAVVGANPAVASVFRHDRDGLAGVAVDRLLPLLRRAMAQQADERREATGDPGGPVRYAVTGRRADGTTFPAEVWAAPVRLQGQAITAMSVRDTTLHEEQVRHLRGMQELQDVVLLAISHELRTPLTVVSGLVDTLVQHGDALDPGRRHDLLQRLSRQTRRFTGLVAELLDIDRLRGGVAPDTALVDVRPVVEGVARESAGQHGLDVTVDVAADVPPVQTNPVLIARVVDNLLANAAKYAPGPVEVRVEPAEGGLVILVEDHGPGVPAPLREQVFEPFRRGDQVDPSAPGMGMGLTLVARVATAARGRAWVQDRPDGRTGASFRLYLPSA